MKKLLIVGAFVMSFGVAVAGPKININTPVKWATSVIKAALNQAGLIGSSDANWDVRVTYERILAELLELDKFSVKQSAEVCLKHCKKSDYLSKGQGASGKKCPDICKSFSDALLAENNKAAKSSTGGKGKSSNSVTPEKDRIYSADRKFYIGKGDTIKLSVNPKQCSEAVFETSTNKKVAVCNGAVHLTVTDSRYQNYVFEHDHHCNRTDSSCFDNLYVHKSNVKVYNANRTYYAKYVTPVVCTSAGYNALPEMCEFAVFDAKTDKQVTKPCPTSGGEGGVINYQCVVTDPNLKKIAAVGLEVPDGVLSNTDTRLAVFDPKNPSKEF